jgi:hypothetical protein
MQHVMNAIIANRAARVANHPKASAHNVADANDILNRLAAGRDATDTDMSRITIALSQLIAGE